MEQGVIRKPMPLYVRFENYNTNNEHAYDPYFVSDNGRLIIDKTWWHSHLSDFMRDQINRDVPSFDLEDVVTPHEYSPQDVTGMLTIVYRAYMDGFDYHRWFSHDIPNGPKGVVMIPLDSETKRILSTRNIEDEGLGRLREQLQTFCDGREIFMRLSATSGKNEKAVRPFKSPDEIIKHLMSVEEYRAREYSREKETVLVLVPWNDIIDPRCEMRIFVVNEKLTAASPQRYWELHQHTSEELEAFENALNNIAFLNKVPYKTFVADVYIDVKTSVCHLIELNPFGAHSPAGSSFFNWIDDYDILYGKAPAEFRYLSAINY